MYERTFIQMKSSMTFILGNGWTDIDLILKEFKYGGGLYDDRSALSTITFGVTLFII